MPTDDESRFATIRSTLRTAIVGDILDSVGRSDQYLPAAIGPIAAGMVVVGRAMPVLSADVFGDQKQPFGRLTEAVDSLMPGDAYVGRGGREECAAWGELLTATALHRGAVGAVLDGYHRDTDQLVDQQWPVFSRGGCGRDSRIRAAVIDFGVPIEIGRVLIEPGDLIFGDADGVIVVPAEIADEILESAAAKAAGENLVRSAIEAGMSSTDAFREYGIL